jgi:hypothetical protein
VAAASKARTPSIALRPASLTPWSASLSPDSKTDVFDLLECQDMAEAIDVVAAHPLASRCVLEIRPVVA